MKLSLVLAASLLSSSVLAGPYDAPRPRAAPERTVRLDVAKKRVRWLDARCPFGVMIEQDITPKNWLARQIARIDTITVGESAVTLHMSDGRDVSADRAFAGRGFFDPTTLVSLYVALDGDTATVALVYRGTTTCAEKWMMPVTDEIKR